MTKEQRFLLTMNINDVVTNPHEKSFEKWVYISDVLREWTKHNQQIQADKKSRCHVCNAANGEYHSTICSVGSNIFCG